MRNTCPSMNWHGILYIQKNTFGESSVAKLVQKIHITWCSLTGKASPLSNLIFSGRCTQSWFRRWTRRSRRRRGKSLVMRTMWFMVEKEVSQHTDFFMTNKKRISYISRYFYIVLWSLHVYGQKRPSPFCQICILHQLSHFLLSFWQSSDSTCPTYTSSGFLSATKFNLYVGHWRTAETRRFCTQGHPQKPNSWAIFWDVFFNSPTIFGGLTFLRNHFFPHQKIPINLLRAPFGALFTREWKLRRMMLALGLPRAVWLGFLMTKSLVSS